MNKEQVEALADKIYQTLATYKCAFTQIEDDGGQMPLVDLLSPGQTIEEGQEECSELAYEIAETIRRHVPPAPSDLNQRSCGLLAELDACLEELGFSRKERAFDIVQELARRCNDTPPAPDARELAERIVEQLEFQPHIFCEARAWHGPGSQSSTRCTIPGDIPHTVHATRYGSYDTFGLWKDNPNPPKGINPTDAFNPDDSNEELMTLFESEVEEREKIANDRKVARVAAIIEGERHE